MIASVSGRRICGGRALAELGGHAVTSPPSSRIVARTASMPTPRPEMSLVTSAVEKPGWKSSSTARLACRSSRPASAAISPRSAALRATLRGVDAAAVVARR